MSKIFFILIISIFLFFSTAYLGAEGSAEGKKNYEHFYEMANFGDIGAQFTLGHMYYIGEGVSINYKKAFKWFKKAAQKDHIPAKYFLGFIYYTGKGRKKNEKMAVSYFEEAAKGGYVLAQEQLGFVYYYGVGVPADEKKAIDWHEIALENGSKKSLIALGKMYYKKSENYYNGTNGYEKNRKKGGEWLQKSADFDYFEAKKKLSGMYFDCGVKYYYGVKINQNFDEAIKCFKDAAFYSNDVAKVILGAAQGDVEMQLKLGVMYYEGVGVVLDKQLAKKWFKKANLYNDTKIQLKLGIMYYDEKKFFYDEKKARQWLSKAAENGNKTAKIMLNAINSNPDDQFKMGLIYGFGSNGVDQDHEEAFYWCRLSALDENPIAQYTLAYMYMNEIGTKKDYFKAVEWYRKSSEQGYFKAQYNLGAMYYRGQGVERNIEEAAKWFFRSANQGYTIAQYVVGVLYLNGEGVARNKYLAERWLDLAADKGYQKARDLLRDSVNGLY